MTPRWDALVGYPGFVGRNLASQLPFRELYSSANSAQMAGRHFDRVTFSAARAEKWRANADPDTDRRHIEELKRLLTSFQARQLVLISTVDVYADPVGVDERTPVDAPGLHPYGAHRRELEEFARARFDDVLVVRLPGLFGAGIKKNVVFDLMTGNDLHRVDHRGVFQYYDLARLAGDLEVALAAGLSLVNFATEPVSTADVAEHAFGLAHRQEVAGATPGRYDFRSVHAALFGGSKGYLYSAAQVLDDLQRFVAAEGRRR